LEKKKKKKKRYDEREAQPGPIHVHLLTAPRFIACTEFTEVVWRRRRDMMMKGIEEGRTTWGQSTFTYSQPPSVSSHTLFGRRRERER
jgi:hypothetical protein